jgi:hypothetical protein
VTAAMEVMLEREKRRSFSLNFRFRLSVLELACQSINHIKNRRVSDPGPHLFELLDPDPDVKIALKF